MATKIKFRAKDAQGAWHYGDLLRLDKDTAVIVEKYGAVFQSADEIGISKGGGAQYFYVQPDTICSYVTECRDLQGWHDVYSGDIIRGHKVGSGINPHLTNYVIEHVGSDIRARKCGTYEKHDSTDYTHLEGLIFSVIGNVYDNEELLKK